MADEETIVIKVNAAQGEAALKALGAAGIKAGKDLETVATTGGSGVGSITDKYAALTAKLFGLTKIIGAAGVAFKEVAIATGNYNENTKEAIDNTSNFAAAIASLDFAGAAASLGQLLGQLEAWGDEVNKHPVILGNATLANEKLREAMRSVMGAANDLVAAHEKETGALNTKAGALVRLTAQQQAEGEVQKFVRDEIQATLDAYTKTGEVVPEEFAKVAASLGIVSKAQQDATASALELEQAGVKSSAARSKAEAEAAQVIIQALAAQREQYKAFLEETAKFVAEQDAILAKPNQGFDSSEDATEAKASLAGLNQQIKAIRDNPIITEDQDKQLRDLTRQARAAGDAVRSASQAFTLSAMNGEELAEKQNAAWNKYYALRHANDAIVQQNVDDDLRALGEQNDAVGDLSDSAEGAADAFSDLADAAGSLGDESKKGADKAGEGIDKLKEGLTEALPLAEQLRTVLQDIVAIAASADI